MSFSDHALAYSQTPELMSLVMHLMDLLDYFPPCAPVTPQLQAIDRMERAGDLLTLSPSEAHERIKSGRQRLSSARKSSLSRGKPVGQCLL